MMKLAPLLLVGSTLLRFVWVNAQENVTNQLDVNGTVEEDFDFVEFSDSGCGIADSGRAEGEFVFPGLDVRSTSSPPAR